MTPAERAAYYSSITAALTGRSTPSGDADNLSNYWVSDREIYARRKIIGTVYSTEDFQAELVRSERKVFWLTVLSIAVAVVAVIAILVVVFL